MRVFLTCGGELTIPDDLLAELNLSIGSRVTITRERDGLFVSPVKLYGSRLKFDINELMKNTDFDAQRSDVVLRSWNR